MEKEREITKLINVLYRIARAANFAAWVNSEPDAARFCVTQYNKVLARLTELEPAIAPLFVPLPESTSPQVVRMAARELIAYFADEPEAVRGRFRYKYRGCGPRGVKVGWAYVHGRRC